MSDDAYLEDLPDGAGCAEVAEHLAEQRAQKRADDTTFMSGRAVAERVFPTRRDQIQPAGVDLTVESMFRIGSAGHIGVDGKTIGGRREMDTQNLAERPGPGHGDGWFVRRPVVVEYGEIINVPDDHLGLVLPRSSLLRNGAEIFTAVWDPGFEGVGEGLLVPHGPGISIEQGARVGQFVLASVDAEESYDGDYQGDGLEEDDS